MVCWKTGNLIFRRVSTSPARIPFVSDKESEANDTADEKAVVKKARRIVRRASCEGFQE